VSALSSGTWTPASVCRPIPWSPLPGGAQVQLANGVPVQARFPLELDTFDGRAECRLDIYAMTSCLVSFGARWETSDGFVTVALYLRGASCR
jgi:hypothetical protein